MGVGFEKISGGCLRTSMGVSVQFHLKQNRNIFVSIRRHFVFLNLETFSIKYYNTGLWPFHRDKQHTRIHIHIHFFIFGKKNNTKPHP
jgi:hypothetical protein